MMKRLIFIVSCLLLLFSCSRPENLSTSADYPFIYPDYINVSIPQNIAPLNFMIRDSVEQMAVLIQGKNKKLTVTGGNKISIPLSEWKELLSEGNQQLEVTVTASKNENRTKFKPFYWQVVADKIDPILTYRLIEPGYEVWNKLQIIERNIGSFDERVLADNNLIEGSCMNCHISGGRDKSVSMFHIRGKHGGTVLNRNGKLQKINIRNGNMVSSAIYGNIDPTGQYAVFSTNVVIPELHTYRSEKMEVYDAKSDLVVLDFDTNRIITQPFLSETTAYESFPVFSADGRTIYFCSAPYVPLPDSIKSLKYNICSVRFDPQSRTLGNKIDTLWNAQRMNGSVSHLKTSPDGKYLLYTVADYGTFPIWHREADLQLMNLETGAIDKLKMVNDTCSDSYHSWSSNSRWFVFASKRDDGIYGKPYFCYVDSTGKTCKPFVLPQKNPEIYDNTLKSFNIPELLTNSVPFDARDIENVYWDKPAETVE